jgi:membrane protease YdiL (CAAX protease family)
MTTIRAFVRSHATATYFVVTFATSWGVVLAVGGLRGMSSEWQSDLPFLMVAMLAGPAVSGLVLTALVSGRGGLHELLARLLRWRVGARWYAVALLTAPVVFGAVHAALALISPLFLPSLVTTRDPASLLVFATVAAATVGVCEELGWTGFAVPRLAARHSAFVTGLIVGVLWGAWHLLTNDLWIAGASAGDLPVAWFVTLNGIGLVGGQLVAYRVLMVWLYNRTGSLLLAMLMHASLSACTFILGPAALTGSVLVGYGFVLAGAWWLVVAAGAAIRSWQSAKLPSELRREKVA